jgi:uncharacterized membrane protein YccC
LAAQASEPGWIGRHRAELRLSIRVSVAGLIAYLLADMLDLPQGFWAVITAVIVIQTSVGASIKAALDRLVGTIGGAAVGAIVAIVLLRAGESWRAVAVFVALLPLALGAALSPSLRIAPVTALIMLLGTTTAHPLRSAFERVIEIGLGNVVGIGVALLVLPARAHELFAGAAKRVAEVLATLFPLLLGGLEGQTQLDEIRRLHAAALAGLKQLDAAADEAKRERRSFLTDQPDPEPLTRTLYRVRHDMVMTGRASADALPANVAERLRPMIARVETATVGFLREAGEAMGVRGAPPDIAPVEEAYSSYATAMQAIRAERLTRPLSDDQVAQVFALAFGFEQLRRDLADLHSRVTELAQRPPAA